MARYILVTLCAFFLALGPARAQSTQGACDTSRAFCVETINPGLSSPSSLTDRATPRAVLESFLFLAERGAWEEAAHLLHLRSVPEGQQRSIGASLAQQLETVISRKAVVNWDRLVDRSDGVDAQQSSDRARAGEPRRSLLLWTLELGSHPAAIRLNRLKPAEG